MTCHSCWWHWPWWRVAQHQRQEKSRAQVSNVPSFFCSATHWLPINSPSPLLRDVGSINIATAPSPGENSMQTGQRRQQVWTPITRAEDEEEKGCEVQNANSDEDRWRRAQVSTPSPLHPPTPRLLTPHMHARDFPPPSKPMEVPGTRRQHAHLECSQTTMGTVNPSSSGLTTPMMG